MAFYKLPSKFGIAQPHTQISNPTPQLPDVKSSVVKDKHVVIKEHSNRTYKKIICDREIQFNSHSVPSDTKIQKNLASNLYSLHDPFDFNHLQGLRNRLFSTFNEFANILENAMLPPVLKNIRKISIKIGEFDHQTFQNNIFDLNLLVSEIKTESKNEDLHSRNKSNSIVRKEFQIKLAQCYKLAINTTKMCSKTLEADIFNPIQCKMKNLIQTISTLSLTTGKYLYGDLYKKKEKESYDLVQRCKVLKSMLDDVGYKDTDNDDCIHHEKNVLNELANKALNKTKTKLLIANSKQISKCNQGKPKLRTNYAQKSTAKSFKFQNKKGTINNHSYNDISGKKMNDQPMYLKLDKTRTKLFTADSKQSSIYNQAKPKLESNNAQKSTTKSFEGVNNSHSFNDNNSKMFYDKPLFINLDKIENSDNLSNDNLDKIKIPVQEYPKKELNLNLKDIENICSNTQNLKLTESTLSTSCMKSNKLKPANNVGLYIVKENRWRHFPVKNNGISQSGNLILSTSKDDIEKNVSYKIRFGELSIKSQYQMDIIYNITESILEDLIKEVISKICAINDEIVNNVLRSELF